MLRGETNYVYYNFKKTAIEGCESVEVAQWLKPGSVAAACGNVFFFFMNLKRLI